MAGLQEWLHRIEEGAGARYLRLGLAALVLIVLTFGYHWRVYKNMSVPEAMDAAQLARNISEGRGYTTQVIRPFSFHLVSKKNLERGGEAALSDPGRIKTSHPDLANPPLYPVLLAGWMKVLPFHHDTGSVGGFWNREGRFWWYQPDYLITLFNQGLFLVAVVLVFILARRLFDTSVAWISALLFFGTELFWKFATSGLSTILLVVVFLALAWCLTLLEQHVREETASPARMLGLAAACGALVALGALTRYSFGWLIVPVLFFVILFGGQRRTLLAIAATAAFLLLLLPWVARNYHVSGTPFGTAGYAVVETTASFQHHRLARSLNPDFTKVQFRECLHKLLANSREIVQNDIPKLGGSWVSAFFLVGLLVGFRNPGISRLRYFLLAALVVLVVVQALGKTHLSSESPGINSENLLVLLAPLVFIYGVSLFLILLDQISLPFREARYIVIGLFGLLACAPMVFAFMPPRSHPIAYPPYFPPVIQQTCSWMREDELMMSDIPWGVAWYGNRQCLWLTLNAQDDFFAINDYQKPIKALYLTPQTMDSRFLSEWIRSGEHSWGSFILESILRREVPANFPLRKSPAGFMPEQLFLTDSERWVRPAAFE